MSYMNEKVPEIMKSIGFKKSSGQHYVHPNCEKFIEFVLGPPGIGDDTKIKPAARNVEGQTLFLYSPTDCICDRLASYIHFRARECLDQAALVAAKFPFDRKKVRAWCVAEGAPEAFDQLIAKLKTR